MPRKAQTPYIPYTRAMVAKQILFEPQKCKLGCYKSYPP
jgi:hypothetical protein